ncbi:hypothetical protein SERLA73DRAFT_136742 [Serpula lacrymans var. lacrymans S7.3]|uniref:Uncharacterized protein n=2 Tax=Serpula lacrymans var. lacrymans TaxID=341189 RepID=F8PY30_SERL3|nr:uncharacterized protein SERLADRAFT_389506 [Serpula lacrymans var. lacrymans S7.9]EGN98793.1 hypothetical protein SERLA73DRAFT_136742 [Serpula lacrymans var. lacrymans S7.3]EGO24387.1 hypothetical protein SERLADRAFT_389506 [Serpula lacrymans var. lacrymans S7.9]
MAGNVSNTIPKAVNVSKSCKLDSCSAVSPPEDGDGSFACRCDRRYTYGAGKWNGRHFKIETKSVST